MKSLTLLLAAQAAAWALPSSLNSYVEMESTHTSPGRSSFDLAPRYPGDTLVLVIPESAPDNASDIVNRSFPGLAISSHSFHEYTGSSSGPNEVSKNLIRSISTRTGEPVSIRVGGTSGDFASYDSNQEQAIVLPDDGKGAVIPIGMTIGTSWFEGFGIFDAAVKWTYMAQLAHFGEDVQNKSASAASLALKHIGSNLEALEIGNEPDLYASSGNWAKDLGVSRYITSWQDFLEAIGRSANNDNLPTQALAISHKSESWSVSGALTAGASKSTTGEISPDHVISASVHNYMHYGMPDEAPLQAVFMNHTAVVNKLDPFRETVSWLKTNRPGVALHLGEIGSSTHPDYASDKDKILSSFGAALWLADYMLYGLTVGIKKMNVQQSTHFSCASWRPVEYNGMPPAVLPQFYAHPFVADIIGKDVDVRISNIETGLDTFSAYAVYNAETTKLLRVVLINLQTWRTTEKNRPGVSVTLNIGSKLKGKLTVDKLTAPGADVQDSSKVSWKNLSWTWESKGKEFKFEGADTSTFVRGVRGSFGGLGVQASEAVVVNLEGATDDSGDSC